MIITVDPEQPKIMWTANMVNVDDCRWLFVGVCCNVFELTKKLVEVVLGSVLIIINSSTRVNIMIVERTPICSKTLNH